MDKARLMELAGIVEANDSESKILIDKSKEVLKDLIKDVSDYFELEEIVHQVWMKSIKSSGINPGDVDEQTYFTLFKWAKDNSKYKRVHSPAYILHNIRK